MARRNNIYTIYIGKERVYFGAERAEFIKTLCSYKNHDLIVRIGAY